MQGHFYPFYPCLGSKEMQQAPRELHAREEPLEGFSNLQISRFLMCKISCLIS